MLEIQQTIIIIKNLTLCKEPEEILASFLKIIIREMGNHFLINLEKDHKQKCNKEDNKI